MPVAKKTYEPFGLYTEEVNQRLVAGRSNVKKEENLKTNWQIISSNLFTFFNMVLALIAALLISIGSYENTWFIVIATINTGIGIYQELKAKSIIKKLSLISTQKVTVVREGICLEIDVEDVVIDDLVFYDGGKQIVADAVVQDGRITVNEANITGESDAVRKSIGDRLYSGSFVVSGEAYTKVTAVGADNYVAKLQHQAQRLNKPKSVILGTLKKILRFIGVIIIPLGIMTFYNVFKTSNFDYLPDFIASNDDFALAVTKMAGSMVAMVPSGLFLLTTITFSVSVIRLAKQKTLVQELYSIETLARVDTLCLDKTGTITDGTMTVEKLELLKDFAKKRYTENSVTNIIASMNFALKDRNQTALALHTYFGKEEHHKAKETVPFNSQNKYAAVNLSNGVYVLGAPEIIYRQHFSEIKAAVEGYAKMGKRVLLLAEADKLTNEQFSGKARAVALIIINDHIRESAKKTIAEFKEANVAIKVISGDNPLTVAEVSRRVGVEHAERYISMDTVSDEEIQEVSRNYNVFGRVKPYQKQQLLECFQADEHKVAMIGDGVNDILALKQADVSISLASGTDATRSISHLVLLDDDFQNLPKVVKEGRQIVCNMENASVLYLTKTLYTILLTFILLMTSQIYPFEPIQMFVIETFIVGIPTFWLAIEKHDKVFKGSYFKNLMKQVVPGALFVILNLLGVYIFSGAFYNLTNAEISTVGIIAATFAYWLILANASYPFNRFRLTLVIFAFVTSALCFTVFSDLFRISPLSIPAVLLMLLLMETTYISMSFFHGRFL